VSILSRFPIGLSFPFPSIPPEIAQLSQARHKPVTLHALNGSRHRVQTQSRPIREGFLSLPLLRSEYGRFKFGPQMHRTDGGGDRSRLGSRRHRRGNRWDCVSCVRLRSILSIRTNPPGQAALPVSHMRQAVHHRSQAGGGSGTPPLSCLWMCHACLQKRARWDEISVFSLSPVPHLL
jgi:hypothetical protein